ncbi:MAG: hypothetical protein K2V38_12820 [Gemmataceae bacterium]|nr:hypothetical protein [Gemmataceae bacterium]
MTPTWEPNRNAVHRLIQYLDILAIAFNRFRQRSFLLPTYSPPEKFDTEGWQAGVRELQDEFNAVRRPLFRLAFSPHLLAERLGHEAVAEFAQAGARDEGTIAAVAEAARWVGFVGTPWNAGAPRPWNYGVYDPERMELSRRGEDRFEIEFQLLERYTPARGGLLFALARAGLTIPAEIYDRRELTFRSWGTGQDEPITQGELLELVWEVAPGADGSTVELEPPEAEPAPQRQTRRGNRKHEDSDDPQRRYRANLYDNILAEKGRGEGAKKLAQRLSHRADLVGLAEQAGIDSITAQVVENALQYGRNRDRNSGANPAGPAGPEGD